MQLAQHFLDKTCRDFGREPMRLTQSQATQIRRYDWPGNVRELKNLIERAVILATSNVPRLEISRVAPQLGAEKNGDMASSAEDGVLTEIQMKEFRRNNILKALDASAWKVSGTNGAAALLGVKPTTLADRMKALGIKKPAI